MDFYIKIFSRQNRIKCLPLGTISGSAPALLRCNRLPGPLKLGQGLKIIKSSIFLKNCRNQNFEPFVRDAKGKVVGMEKVKVTRYMTGKRPDWAPEEFDSDEELNIRAKSIKIKVPGKIEKEKQESDVS